MISKFKPRIDALLPLGLLLLAGCVSYAPAPELPPDVQQRRIDDLSQAIRALGGTIDHDEARRAAVIAIEYSRELAHRYRVSGSAIYHNLLVNLGVRERGLCIHWTEDLMARLEQEQFRTLELHWAIANYTTAFRLEHSTVIVSALGDSLQRGIVLDPWRYSGDLYWAPTLADVDHPWEPRADVHALKKLHQAENENWRLER